jgi:hypothetical protein
MRFPDLVLSLRVLSSFTCAAQNHGIPLQVTIHNERVKRNQKTALRTLTWDIATPGAYLNARQTLRSHNHLVWEGRRLCVRAADHELRAVTVGGEIGLELAGAFLAF